MRASPVCKLGTFLCYRAFWFSCLKLVWLMFANSGSLWVGWHKFHHIRGKSFWSLPDAARLSWNWKCLLRLRVLARPFMDCKLGNGLLASFWFDRWTPMGPLISFIGNTGPSDWRIPLDASVASVSSPFGWGIPPLTFAHALSLQLHLSTISLPLNAAIVDQYSWVIDGQRFQRFPTANTWDVIRPRQSTKDWVASVWFKGATPKHAFNMWVSHLSRLPTRVRLAVWGLPISSSCCLCADFEESIEHLLLRCGFSAQIWSFVQSRLRLSPCIFISWNSLLAWTTMKTDSAPPLLRKLVVHAIVYHVWKQKNNLLHNGTSLSPLATFKDIDREIRNTITARRNRKAFRSLMLLWIR